VAEPGLAEATGVLGFDDALAFGVQFDIVTDAPAEGAGRVLHDGQAHRVHSAFCPDPGGMVNIHPSSRPRQLPRIPRAMSAPARAGRVTIPPSPRPRPPPRMRRGMYRPVSICSQGRGLAASVSCGTWGVNAPSGPWTSLSNRAAPIASPYYPRRSGLTIDLR